CTWFTLSLSIFCLLFFHCSRAHRDLHSFPTRRSSDLALVVAELAAAVMLLSGAGLLIRSFWNLQHVAPGFQPAGVLKAEFQLPRSEEHTSELQSLTNLVCRLLLEKKKNNRTQQHYVDR